MRILYFFILLLIPLSLFSQGELDNQQKIFYRNERTIGLLLNSNGVGGNFRYAKRADAFKKSLYEIEFNYLKHPKEVKVSSDASTGRFVYGKLNAAYTLKGALGVQKEMFQKRDQGGISIRYFYNFGPSLAILKPIYYEYSTQDSTYYEKFVDDPAQTSYITGKAAFSIGFSEIKVRPGIYGKFGFTFEYSSEDEIFHALELGLAFDAYLGKVSIMSAPAGKLLFVLPDDQFILTLFISYRFGKVIDAQFNTNKNKIDKLLID